MTNFTWLSSRCANVAALLFTACFAVIRLAHAEDEYRAALLRAMVAKEQALDSHSSSDWEETLRRLQQADAIKATAEATYEIAYAEAELGRSDIAVETYERALALGLTGTAADKARSFVAEQKLKLARVEVFGEPGSRVRMRGVKRGELPLTRPLYVLPGTLNLELITPANRHFERQLMLIAGDLETVHFETETVGASAATRSLVLPPAPASNPSAEPSNTASTFSPRQTGWLLVGTGTTLGVLGAVFIPISGKLVNERRQALAAACEVQLSGPDSCAHAKPGRQSEAQSASNSSATWEMVRDTSWVATAVGLTAATTGAILLVSSKANTKSRPVAPRVTLGKGALEISIVSVF